MAVNFTNDEQKLVSMLHAARHDEKLVALFKRLRDDADTECRAAVPIVQLRRAQGKAALLAELITAFEKR